TASAAGRCGESELDTAQTQERLFLFLFGVVDAWWGVLGSERFDRYARAVELVERVEEHEPHLAEEDGIAGSEVDDPCDALVVDSCPIAALEIDDLPDFLVAAAHDRMAARDRWLGDPDRPAHRLPANRGRCAEAENASPLIDERGALGPFDLRADLLLAERRLRADLRSAAFAEHSPRSRELTAAKAFPCRRLRGLGRVHLPSTSGRTAHPV